jgi:hypothetical protein
MARHNRRFGLIEAVLALFFVAVLGAAAYGDGGFLPPVDYSGSDLTEPCQQAVLVHAAGREALFLFVDYHGASGKFAWLIPCPTQPTVRVASANVLKETADYYHHLEMLAWNEALRKRPVPNGEMGGGGLPPQAEEIRIHDIKHVGPYEIATVSATKGEALYGWLNKNGYAIPPWAAPVLKAYVDEQWFFAAVKVTAAAGQLQTLPPIMLQFPTEVPIYPLRISAVSPGVVDVRVYFFRERTAQRPREEEDARAVREDFRKHCPALSEELPDVAWQKLRLSRITDTLVPEVMRRLDDRIHYKGARAAGAFYPVVSLARTVGIAEALVASDAAVAKWAEEKLSYYMYAKPRPGDLDKEHLAALRETGKRLGLPLRDKLLAYIGARVEAAKGRAQSFGRADWRGYLMSAENSPNLEAATILLVRTCAPDDHRVLTMLEETVRVAGSGTYWGDAIMDLRSPASRRVLARIAEHQRDLGAAFRYVYSLERNAIDPRERATAARELLSLLSKSVMSGDASTRGNRLLRTYTGQDFGSDWDRWKNWLDQNTNRSP